MKFFTIGYGGRKPKDFMNLLKQGGIKTIVDIRLRPHRGGMGAYIKAKDPNRGIEGLLASGNIDYLPMSELGNIYIDYEDWSKLYQRLLDRAGDLLFERLIQSIQQISLPFCLMCSEKEVSKCHRQLVADFLVQKGFEVEHIE